MIRNANNVNAIVFGDSEMIKRGQTIIKAGLGLMFGGLGAIGLGTYLYEKNSLPCVARTNDEGALICKVFNEVVENNSTVM